MWERLGTQYELLEESTKRHKNCQTSLKNISFYNRRRPLNCRDRDTPPGFCHTNVSLGRFIHPSIHPSRLPKVPSVRFYKLKDSTYNHELHESNNQWTFIQRICRNINKIGTIESESHLQWISSIDANRQDTPNVTPDHSHSVTSTRI